MALLKMTNISLIGMMGSGKSTLSHHLSVMTGYKVIDTDDLIEKNESLSIKEIFAIHHEKYFRELELNLLKKSKFSESIISTGGGLITQTSNCRQLKKMGCVIYLKGSIDTLYNRLNNQIDNRPLLDKQVLMSQLESLLDARETIYETTADLIVSIDSKSVDEICKEIYTFLRELDYKFLV